MVDAFADAQPARLSWGTGVARFVMNRREFTERGVILGVNPRGHADRSVPVLRVDSLDGQPRAVLFGAACHNTTPGQALEISGDFAGYAQAEIQRVLPDALAMFMQGCGGDANPFPRGDEAVARKHGRDLGQEVLGVQEIELPQRKVTEEEYTEAQAAVAEFQKRPSEGRTSWSLGWHGKVVERYEHPEDNSVYKMELHVLRLGDIAIASNDFELFTDFGIRMKARSPAVQTFLIQLAGPGSYVPTDRAVEGGGYSAVVQSSVGGSEGRSGSGRPHGGSPQRLVG